MEITASQKKLLLALKAVKPCRPGAEDVEAMDARQRRIELLYELSGRTNMVYSGLSFLADEMGL